VKPAIFGRTQSKSLFTQVSRHLFGRLRMLWVMLLAALLLSGCVKYDLGVNFQSQHRGELVQHIKLGEQLTNFSSSQAQDWLKSVEQRARQLQGKIKRLSDQELIVTIPFSTGSELESKFNKFFNPSVKKGAQFVPSEELDLPSLNSKLSLTQSNLLLFVRNQLSYNLDLRSLGVISSNGSVIVSPSSLFDLEFSLQTPWGARSVENVTDAIKPTISDNGHRLVWILKPGQINHLEAVFWLPSPLGFGALIISLLVVVGFYLKYNRLPGSEAVPAPAPTLSKVQ
jgi:hypothetical protein